MTLPVQPLRADKPPLSTSRRRPACLSAAWADRPPPIRERRRAVCSWSAGYGTLTESTAVPEDIVTAFKKGKVADQAALLEPPRSRRPIASSLAVPHAPPASAIASSHHHQGSAAVRRTSRTEPLSAMPGIMSLLSGGGRRRGGGDDQSETRSPLVKQRNGAEHAVSVKPASSLANLRKCETVQTLTSYLRSSSSSSSIEPLQPVNRLRVSPSTSRSRTCSRCSSLLTLASGSRYSLSSSACGFVPVPPSTRTDDVDGSPSQAASAVLVESVLCKLCLQDAEAVIKLRGCGCAFCIECMRAYVEFEISEGAYDISCPDAQCTSQGVLQLEEIKRLAGSDLLEKHKKYRLNREVELDKTRTWCPRAGCETVCTMCPTQKCAPQSVFCPTCTSDFCSNCKLEWHDGLTCDDYSKQLTKDGKAEEPGIPFDSDLIKCCPMCNVPIEKDEGCAQMMCKRCKHVFCWYCLASLDDDFLLRHYDKGPCKNKLGHSRASVIWHRTQVIGIFAGFGILLLVASPLLLLAAPCIVCCKCRFCNTGTTKLDNEEETPADES